MDSLEGGIETFLIRRVCSITDTNQAAIEVKQSAPTATRHGLTGHLHIGRSEILINCRDLTEMDRWISTTITANGGDVFANGEFTLRSSHPGRRDLRIREDTHEGHVAVEIPRHELPGKATGFVASKKIDRNPPFAA